MQTIPHDKKEWLGAFFRILIFLAVLAEGWCFLGLHLVDRYRYQERRKAMADWARQQTPETKALWDAEKRLLSVHQDHRALFVIASFMFVDGVMVYFLWNYGEKKRSA